MKHTLLKIEIIEGKSNVNLDELSKLLLDNGDKRLNSDPIYAKYEDSYCPPSPLIDQVSEEMIHFFKKHTGLDIHSNGDYWGHIHEKNMSTNIHDHIGSHVSSVLYVSAPEGSGEIVFKPRKNHFVSFPPKEGTFYIFPSFMEHYVTRNNSDKKRISLSINFNTGIGNE
tara:strand:- start:68 stop:574 length:507 start_codon:yes stop_codon:yes gene_type:complete